MVLMLTSYYLKFRGGILYVMTRIKFRQSKITSVADYVDECLFNGTENELPMEILARKIAYEEAPY